MATGGQTICLPWGSVIFVPSSIDSPQTPGSQVSDTLLASNFSLCLSGIHKGSRLCITHLHVRVLFPGMFGKPCTPDSFIAHTLNCPTNAWVECIASALLDGIDTTGAGRRRPKVSNFAVATDLHQTIFHSSIHQIQYQLRLCLFSPMLQRGSGLNPTDFWKTSLTKKSSLLQERLNRYWLCR